MEGSLPNNKKLCACGCGSIINRTDINGKEIFFHKGHRNTNVFGKGSKHPDWKGGRIYSHGYVMVWIGRDYPSNHNGYVFEHRYVMEQYLGRYLNKDELVHHKNEIRTDNRLENLQIMTHAQHQRHHLKGKPNPNPRPKLDMTGRKCSRCGSEKTRIYKGDNIWYGSPDRTGFYCQKCYTWFTYHSKH